MGSVLVSMFHMASPVEYNDMMLTGCTPTVYDGSIRESLKNDTMTVRCISICTVDLTHMSKM